MDAVKAVIRMAWPMAMLALFASFAFSGGDSSRLGAEGGSSACDAIREGDIAALQRCLTQQADDVDAMAELGAAYEQAARWDSAEAIYLRALQVEPRDADLRIRLGTLVLRRGDAATAIRQGEMALSAQPGSTAAQQLIDRAAAAQGSRP